MWFINKTVKILIFQFCTSMHLSLGLGLGLDHWSFIWSEHSIKSMSCSKFQIRVNSAKSHTSKFNHYIKT